MSASHGHELVCGGFTAAHGSMAWMSERACIDVDPAVFFPDFGETAARAKAICASCPVTAQCLALAIETRELHGVWGGLSPKERRVHQKGVKRSLPARCGTDGGYYRHLRHDHTEPCQPCRDAHAEAQRTRKSRRLLAVVR